MRAARSAIAPVLAVAMAAAGCGAEDDYANEPRPAVPINVTAAVTDEGVTASPARFGAGPVVLILANQTDDPQEVTLETDAIDGSGPGIRQRTGPMNPRGTARLQVDLAEGTYEVRTADRAIEPAILRVNGRRRSAQNQLMTP